jgi:diguanylate cyclase (GGDEF)-like protein/PAS domain S-box-containing protein
MQAVDGSGKDIPVLMMVDTVDDATLLQAMERGVRGIVLRGRPPHVLSVVRTEWADLEARRAQRLLEAQVRETERRCDALIDSSREPIAYVHEGMHIRANQAYLEMFGFDAFEDIEGMSLLDLVAPSHVADFKTLLKKLSKGETPPPRHELQARDQEGHNFPAVMEFTPAFYEGESCIQIVFRRQESDPELAREVEALRQRDQTTGLLNRPTFLQALEGAVAGTAQSGTANGLLLVEPDHFVALIQEIGLDAADDLIAALADRLRSALGADDVAARFGEHQFAVLSRNSDHVGTVALAERVRSAFADHVFPVGARSLSATVSIGGVQIGEKIASVTQVLAKASQGVQSSVGVGGNRAEIFDPVRWIAPRKSACARGSSASARRSTATASSLHYQPVISLHGEPGETYEALLRLRGGRKANSCAADVPAGRRRTRIAVGDRPLGRRRGDPSDRRTGTPAQGHHAAGQDHPGLAGRRHAGEVHREQLALHKVRAIAWCCSCRSPRCSPTCRRRRPSAPRWRPGACAWGWNSSARASTRSS